jgi:hypothetical protein
VFEARSENPLLGLIPSPSGSPQSLNPLPNMTDSRHSRLAAYRRRYFRGSGESLPRRCLPRTVVHVGRALAAIPPDLRSRTWRLVVKPARFVRTFTARSTATSAGHRRQCLDSPRLGHDARKCPRAARVGMCAHGGAERGTPRCSPSRFPTAI